MRILLLLCLAFALAACDSNGDETERKPMFVPLQDGNSWSYARSLPSSEAGADPFTVTLSRGDREGRTVFNLNTGFAKYANSFYEYTEDGLRHVQLSSSGSVSYDYTYLFDLKRPFYSHVGNPRLRNWNFSTRVISTDTKITTPAGTFKTVVLLTVWVDAGGTLQMRKVEYYALGVGVVRYKSQTNVPPYQIDEWDLTSYNVGSAPQEPARPR